jgi:hypothetical protein
MRPRTGPSPKVALLRRGYDQGSDNGSDDNHPRTFLPRSILGLSKLRSIRLQACWAVTTIWSVMREEFRSNNASLKVIMFLLIQEMIWIFLSKAVDAGPKATSIFDLRLFPWNFATAIFVFLSRIVKFGRIYNIVAVFGAGWVVVEFDILVRMLLEAYWTDGAHDICTLMFRTSKFVVAEL